MPLRISRMKPLLPPLMKPAFAAAALLLFSTAVRADVHPHTASPSGKYRLASEAAYQKGPGDTKREIGAVISLIAEDGAMLSKCYHPRNAYLEVNAPGHEEWATTGNWNGDESMVAVGTAGRTWSNVDFFAVKDGRISALPHPDCEAFLFDNLPGYRGDKTRLYASFEKWTGSDTCVMNFSGTAELDESHAERYPDFNYRVTLRIAMEGISVVSLQK